jgi:hypothetical protein
MTMARSSSGPSSSRLYWSSSSPRRGHRWALSPNSAVLSRAAGGRPRKGSELNRKNALADSILTDGGHTLLETVIGVFCVSLLITVIFAFSVIVMKNGSLIRALGLWDVASVTLARGLEKEMGNVRIPFHGDAQALIAQVNGDGIRIDKSCTPSGKEMLVSDSSGHLTISQGEEITFASEASVSGLSVWYAEEGRPIGITVVPAWGKTGSDTAIRALFGSISIPGAR